MVAIRTSAREGPGFGMADVRFGSEADVAVHQPMSALPLKADVCAATRDVRYGPKADMPTLFNYLIGDLLEVHRNFEA
jgi:hypothetical protein